MKFDFSYKNKNGKWVYGAPAFNHYVYTVKGGVQEYNDEVGTEYIRDFIEYRSDSINTKIERKVRKSQLKAI